MEVRALLYCEELALLSVCWHDHDRSSVMFRVADLLLAKFSLTQCSVSAGIVALTQTALPPFLAFSHLGKRKNYVQSKEAERWLGQWRRFICFYTEVWIVLRDFLSPPPPNSLGIHHSQSLVSLETHIYFIIFFTLFTIINDDTMKLNVIHIKYYISLESPSSKIFWVLIFFWMNSRNGSSRIFILIYH